MRVKMKRPPVRNTGEDDRCTVKNHPDRRETARADGKEVKDVAVRTREVL